jgi:DNA invertase Pin-like site-specific DNA recombinase
MASVIGIGGVAKMKAVAAYVRVSTVGQNEEGQRAEIERWLKGNGIKGAKWFIDKRSGDDLQRPAFQKLQAAVFAGEIGTVVVWKLDRLSRSLQDGVNVLSDWCGKGLRLVSVTQQIDFSGVLGKLIAAVLLGIAEMEQQNRRERQAAGIKVARRNGVYKGRKPGTFKADPHRARELRARGLAVEEIARSLGVRRAAIYRYLRGAANGSKPA